VNRRALLFFVVVGIAAVAVSTTWLGNRMSDTAKGASVFEPRTFEGVGLVFVGSGGSYANHLRRGPTLLLGSGTHVVLVDAGRGVAEGLRTVEIPVAEPVAVYLTSLLPENYVGLDDLLTAGWIAGRREPLRVIGPPGTAALVEGLRKALDAGVQGQADGFGLPLSGAEIRVTELTGGESFGEGPLSVRATTLSGGPVPALAYRFEQERVSIVVGGVAWGGEALVELARGAQVLVHEAFFDEAVEMAIEAGALEPERLRREASFRTPLATAGERARQAGVGSLVLVRLRPPPLFGFQARNVVGEAFRGGIHVPGDGDELTFTP
jgi:ribonuclease Z